MNIKQIGDFRFAVEEALQMLSGMAKKYHSLPTENELNAMIERLKKCGTYDVIASILEDCNYKDNKDVYLRAFGGVLSYEVFGGVLADDKGNTFDFWQGMTGKIEENNAVAPSDYPDKVQELSGLLANLVIAMKEDLAEIFGTPEQQAQESSTDKQESDNKVIKRPEGVRCLFGSDNDCNTFFDVVGTRTAAWWAHRAAEYIDNRKLEMDYGFKSILWAEIEKEFPGIAKEKKDPRQTFVRTLNNLGYKSK